MVARASNIPPTHGNLLFRRRQVTFEQFQHFFNDTTVEFERREGIVNSYLGVILAACTVLVVCLMLFCFYVNFIFFCCSVPCYVIFPFSTLHYVVEYLPFNYIHMTLNSQYKTLHSHYIKCTIRNFTSSEGTFQRTLCRYASTVAKLHLRVRPQQVTCESCTQRYFTFHYINFIWCHVTPRHGPANATNSSHVERPCEHVFGLRHLA